MMLPIQVMRFKTAGRILIMSSLSLFSCSDAPTPKPKGYFRIDLPEHTYRLHHTNCPYRFEYATIARVDTNIDAYPCNVNIYYRQFDCKLHITYFPIEDPLREYIEESRTLAMKHIVKASGIDEHSIIIPEHKVYGHAYVLQGNTASSFQFYLTDSMRHFLRGALYFNARPNEDSIAPVEKFIEADIHHLINTLVWTDDGK